MENNPAPASSVEPDKTDKRLMLVTYSPTGVKIKRELCTLCWGLAHKVRPKASLLELGYSCNGKGVSDTQPCFTPLEDRRPSYGE